MRVGGGRLFLIAGPCVLESETHARRLAEAIQRIAADLAIPYIFKASYDKANRTSIRSFRGPGLVEGARILRAIAKDTGLPVLTDVHTPEDCPRLSDALGDVEAVLQIPAFLCRQTDLLIAAAQTGRAINIKKGQFVAPWDMRHAVEKVRDSAAAAECEAARVFLTERGASFGYNNLVVDMRSLPIMRGFAPVVFDGTHSVQTPSAANGVSRRPAGVHPGAGARRGGGRRRRRLPRSARRPGAGEVRRRERAAAGQAEGRAGTAARGPCGGRPQNKDGPPKCRPPHGIPIRNHQPTASSTG